MKNILLPACIIALFFLSACNEQGVDYDTTLPVPPPTTLPQLVNDADSSQINTAAAVQQIQPKVAGSKVLLNPEHGQPGHRCDIAVGAPLGSPAPQIQQTITPAAVSPITTSGSVTLNPPHGQPGHDCAIPVGQPLRS